MVAVRALLLLVAWGALQSQLYAADLYLTDNREFPGQLWVSRDGSAERSIFRSQPTANPAYPRAAMKIGPVAIGPDGKTFFASGLDGYVLHLLDGRNEVLSFEFAGQVRDVDCGNEEHTVYFSVVPTPQNGGPLADGKIYRRDLWAGQPSEVATVRQSEVGGNWWGTFAITDGVTYIATFETPSRVFKLSGAGPQPVSEQRTYKIHGLSAGRDGTFYFTDGTNTIYRTADFQFVQGVFRGGRSFTDVAVFGDAPPIGPSSPAGPARD
jgi:hypothetical protein